MMRGNWLFSIICLSILLVLSGCAEPRSVETDRPADVFSMRLKQATVDRLFDEAQSFVKKADGQESFNLYCHVVEGAWCYFVEHDKIEAYDGHYDPAIENEAHQIDRDFAKQITAELGVEFIAQSKNNGVKIRCTRFRNGSSVQCEVDRGGG